MTFLIAFTSISPHSLWKTFFLYQVEIFFWLCLVTIISSISCTLLKSWSQFFPRSFSGTKQLDILLVYFSPSWKKKKSQLPRTAFNMLGTTERKWKRWMRFSRSPSPLLTCFQHVILHFTVLFQKLSWMQLWAIWSKAFVPKAGLWN